MEFIQTEKSQQLWELLSVIPPDLEGAERFLQTERLTSDEVNRVGLEYADHCYCDAHDLYRMNDLPVPEGIIPGLRSTHLYEVTKLMLNYGLEPNFICNQRNIMEMLRSVDNEFVAADTLDLLLAHGGDPFLDVDGETLFDSVDFDVFFGAVEQYDRDFHDAWVHMWMVLLGYGAKYKDDSPITLYKEYTDDAWAALFDPQKLKDHRKYAFQLIHLEKGFAVSIVDRYTRWEVMRVE